MDTGTPYAKIIPGKTSTVDVIWTHVGVPLGVFNFEHAKAGINNKILLNMHNNDCYQRGVQGISETIDGVIPWLEKVVRDLGATHVRMLGISGGGTAAITFGALFQADVVIAAAPEIELGIPGYRTYDLNTEKVYDKRYRNLTKLSESLGRRLSVSYPAWDISDFRHLHYILRSTNANTFMAAEMHPAAYQFNWQKVLEAPGAIDLNEVTRASPHNWKFSLDDVWRGAAAFEALGRAEVFADSLLCSLHQIDPHNPGICFYAAVQKALLGASAEASRLWREAEVSIDALTPNNRVKDRYRFCNGHLSQVAQQSLAAFVDSQADSTLTTKPRTLNPRSFW